MCFCKLISSDSLSVGKFSVGFQGNLSLFSHMKVMMMLILMTWVHESSVTIITINHCCFPGCLDDMFVCWTMSMTAHHCNYRASSCVCVRSWYLAYDPIMMTLMTCWCWLLCRHYAAHEWDLHAGQTMWFAASKQLLHDTGAQTQYPCLSVYNLIMAKQCKTAGTATAAISIFI